MEELPSREEICTREELPGQPTSFSLYVGHLNSQYSQDTLGCLLKELLAIINVNVQRQDIEIVKKQKCAYALVHLDSESTYQAVLNKLQDPSLLDQNLLEKLVMKGKTLSVGEANRRNPSYREASESGSPYKNTMLQSPQWKINRRTQWTEAAETVSNTKNNLVIQWRNQSSIILTGALSEGIMASQGVVMSQITEDHERLVYAEVFQTELTNAEFKRGGGEYLSMTFKHHIRKYSCAFLNNDGGNLFVGIDDKHVVWGIQCNDKDEDRLRLMVDSVLKGFRPPVLPENYSLAFLPVYKTDTICVFLKVIQLTIQPPKPQEEPMLYETDQGEVYLPIDGIIQGPLLGSAIQEWCRQRWTMEVKKLEEKMASVLQEKEQLEKELQQKDQLIVDLQQQNEEQAAKMKATSKACVIL
ncbi:schlafen-like protein 1 [Microcaecilia unicolor]|uniref:Schlafen-like protein 1 n=1 Tax=Microcaecilia unicolor TaxID=1415580 RepID=A0A6P7ZKH5_9AMPH|nr:schlafen-like protein 1 [Microcaecilia unicolor]